MTKYRSEVNEKNRIRTPMPSGDKITTVYGWTYRDGDYVFEPKKMHNHYEETQAARDSVDLKKIYARYKAGDADALNRIEGFYADTYSMPKNVFEMFDAVEDIKSVFYGMPIEIKEKFNNNPAAFWKEYGTKGFDTFMNDYTKATFGKEVVPEATDVVSEVKTDVQESE